MRAGAAGKVIASKHPKFAVGDHVVGAFGVQEYALTDGKGVTKVDPTAATLPVYLSALGMPGMTAYFGLLDIGQPKAGETVVVSGAAGAVGALVGQIAKVKGCKVVGIAGDQTKCDYIVNELGFDAAINYKSQDVNKTIKKLCPNGIDVYFDNVGGEILDAALANLAFKARIVICGAISQYNSTTGIKGPGNYLQLLIQRARMEGMVVFDYADRFADGARDMAEWIAAGKLRSREHIVQGLKNFPETLLKLFSGENNGKLILEVGAS